jgi:uracil-DNA glycosylase
MQTKIVFIGEAWGEQEARLQSPFVGPAGQELSRMLANAGYSCAFLPYNFNSSIRMLNYWGRFPYPLLNVFNARPPENDVEFFYTKPPSTSPFPPRRFDNGIHSLKPEFEPHVALLHNLLKELKPNVIVALGNTALWALGLPPSISKLRGSIVETPFGKVLPTYHPASVLRKWEQRIVCVLDLHKALRESEYPEIKTLSREIWTQPTVADLYKWWDLYGSKTNLLAFDIETVANKQISEISLASDSTHALHVPFFWKEAGKFINYWPDTASEFAAWKFVKMALESPVPKIGQNCIQYDSYWLAKEMKIGVKNIAHDTMQLSHAWALELEKSLGFLGSIFLDERSWKEIRNETNKQND